MTCVELTTMSLAPLRVKLTEVLETAASTLEAPVS